MNSGLLNVGRSNCDKFPHSVACQLSVTAVRRWGVERRQFWRRKWEAISRPYHHIQFCPLPECFVSTSFNSFECSVAREQIIKSLNYYQNWQELVVPKEPSWSFSGRSSEGFWSRGKNCQRSLPGMRACPAQMRACPASHLLTTSYHTQQYKTIQHALPY